MLKLTSTKYKTLQVFWKLQYMRSSHEEENSNKQQQHFHKYYNRLASLATIFLFILLFLFSYSFDIIAIFIKCLFTLLFQASPSFLLSFSYLGNHAFLHLVLTLYLFFDYAISFASTRP